MQYYEEDFKQMIVELYENGASFREIANDYNISKTSVRNWVNQYKTITKIGADVTTYADIKKLEKEMARLKEENEVLKKCISIFSKK